MNAKNQPVFPGVSAPSIDFEPVRDQRRATLLYVDVDLTSARSQAAGTALTLPIAGNSFYVDQDQTNVGFATVHFQDSVYAGVAPVYVTPGFIANVPFTQIVIENAAQASKRLRIFYGVDIDFQAGINAQVSITGGLALTQASITPHIEYGASYKSITAMAANTPDTVFAPGANTNGAIIWTADLHMSAVNNNTPGVLIAKASAPASIIDGDILVLSKWNVANVFSSSSNYFGFEGKLSHPIKVAAGKGVYYICSGAETAAARGVLYTLL